MSDERGAMGSFSVAVVDERTHVVAYVRGELDLATEGALVHAVEALPEDGRPVVLELAGVSFMDASGLRALLTARARLGERLIVRPGPPAVEHLLRLTGMDSELRDEVAEAEAGLARRAANVKLMRQLWLAYCAGGAAELARWLPHRARPDATAMAEARPWGPEELERFWATRAADATAATVATQLHTAGDSVLVACPGTADAADLIWTVYVFHGRTFIRAVTCASETEARACATVPGDGGPRRGPRS